MKTVQELIEQFAKDIAEATRNETTQVGQRFMVVAPNDKSGAFTIVGEKEGLWKTHWDSKAEPSGVISKSRLTDESIFHRIYTPRPSWLDAPAQPPSMTDTENRWLVEPTIEPGQRYLCVSDGSGKATIGQRHESGFWEISWDSGTEGYIESRTLLDPSRYQRIDENRWLDNVTRDKPKRSHKRKPCKSWCGKSYIYAKDVPNRDGRRESICGIYVDDGGTDNAYCKATCRAKARLPPKGSK